MPRTATGPRNEPSKPLCLTLTTNSTHRVAGEIIRVTASRNSSSIRCAVIKFRSRFLLGWHLPRSPTSFYLISTENSLIFDYKAVEIFDVI